MYRRESPEPSDRNREIYEAVRYDRKKQKELAEKHGLSQPMISKIVSQYEEWLVAHAPNENFAGYEREFLAANAWCERLTQGGHMAQEGYEASCVDRLLPEQDGVRGRWVPARPDMRAIKTMTDCAEKFVTATKARENARHLIIAERDRDPQYQAEQARLRREESQRRVAAQQQRNREAAERANGNVVVVTTPLGDAKPSLEAGDVRTTERADDHATTAAFAPLTNAAQAVIKMGGERGNAAENGASKRLYDSPDSKSPAADLTPQCESVADAEPALGAGDVRTTQRAEDNVVVTLLCSRVGQGGRRRWGPRASHAVIRS